MATPSSSSSPLQRDKRRMSEGAIQNVAPMEQQRRRTIGPAPMTNNKGTTPAKNTPSAKHRLHLGSAAASAYYFSDLPKTPHSAAKSVMHMETNKMDYETTNLAADTSMLSIETSSSEGSSLLNRSVLSDTTELTASNFVLQATSRQRMFEMSRLSSASNPGMGEENETVTELGYDTKGLAISSAAAKRDPLKPANKNDVSTLSQQESASGGSSQSTSLSPFLQKRQNAMSPSTWKALTEKLHSTRMENEEKRRKSLAQGIPLSGLAAQEAAIRRRKSMGDVMTALPASNAEKTGVDATKASPPHSSASSPQQDNTASPSSMLASIADRPGTPHASKTPRNEEEETTEMDLSSPGRIRPSPTSSTEKKLTPTKLSPKPQRVVNPESLESPARNTRSAAKKGASPVGLTRIPVPEGKRKRPDMPTEQIAGTVAFTARESMGGRVSDISMGPFEKRRRSSVGSTSTANTEDVALLLGMTEAAATSVASTKGRMSLLHKSPSPSVGSMGPKSILNSSRKDLSVSRKSVAFGSPEAAEYRIGSPSVSLTPMPRGEAKAKYSIPNSSSSASGTDESADISMDAGDTTTEIEANLSALVQNVAQTDENPASDSPKEEMTSTEDDTSDVQQAVADLFSDVQSTSSNSADGEDTTIELEPNIQGLLNTTAESEFVSDANQLQESPSQGEDEEETEGFGSSAQKIGFSSTSPDSDDGTVGGTTSSVLQNDEEDNTVELEASLTTLLATSGVESTPAYREAPVPSRLSDKFPKVKSNLAPSTNRMSFGDDTGHFNGVETLVSEGKSTMEMEDAMEEVDQSEMEISVLPRTPSENRRLSHRRFSLSSSGRASLLPTGMDEEEDVNPSALILDDGKSPAMPSEGTDSSFSGAAEEYFDLTSAALIKVAELGFVSADNSKENSIDTIVDAAAFCEHVKNSLIGENVGGFIDAVCEEVEKKAASSLDGESCFDNLVETKPNELVRIQQGLRSEDPSKLTMALRDLAKAAAQFVEFEWTSWEIQVAQSLSNSIENISADLSAEKERVDRCVGLADEAQSLLSLVEGRAARKARRRSVDRRKDAASTLEDRIRNLENEVKEAKRNLEAVEIEENAMGSVKDLAVAENKLGAARSTAECAQNDFTTIKAIHSWMPIEIDDTKLVVAVIGSSPRTCLELTFGVSKSSKITCEAKVRSSYFGQRTGMTLKHTASISNYLRANVAPIIESVGESTLQSIDEVRELVRRIELAVARLEATASELSMVQKKYRAALERDPEGKDTDFLLSVAFSKEGEASTTEVLATFEFNGSYPFSPLNVNLDDSDGRIDADGLERQLVRNTKPGFGYLSRTCDTISAYLKGHVVG